MSDPDINITQTAPKKSAIESHATAAATLSAAKPGWQTTEFWIMVLAIVAVVVLVLFDKMTVDQAINLWPMFLGAGTYAVTRGYVKGKQAQQ